MSFINSNLQIGILGGGQLGRMLIQSGISWDLSIHTLDPDPQAPCKFLTPYFKTGMLTDKETVLNFGKNLDLLTIEIEKVNTDALSILEKRGVKVFPQSEVIRIIQNKRKQKDFYLQHHIPTADFILINNKSDFSKKIFFPCVWKSAYGGYDGRGVVKLQNFDSINKLPDVPGFLEKKISIKKEISVIVARNISGEISTFPPVELIYHAKKNLADYLLSPAEITENQKEKIKKIAIKIAKIFGIVGLLAVEMFIDEQDSLLVNEVAPRPHNSGHHTIEANYISQYEQHFRAILNLPLGQTNIKYPSIMVNLLGAEDSEGMVFYEGIEKILKLPGAYVHLYGKKKSKPYRKLGHITLLGKNKSELLKKLSFVKKNVRVVGKPNKSKFSLQKEMNI